MQTPEFEHWHEFNAKTLRVIYKNVVQTPWRDAPGEVNVSDFDATYGNEYGFEQQVLSRTTIPMVNASSPISEGCLISSLTSNAPKQRTHKNFDCRTWSLALVCFNLNERASEQPHLQR